MKMDDELEKWISFIKDTNNNFQKSKINELEKFLEQIFNEIRQDKKYNFSKIKELLIYIINIPFLLVNKNINTLIITTLLLIFDKNKNENNEIVYENENENNEKEIKLKEKNDIDKVKKENENWALENITRILNNNLKDDKEVFLF
jgi:hypothetical protein